ncbi:hypothetical protein [Streptomyces sp. NPDC096013]|uniref:hypothetical protein n=1 Tax=Streptomyces sp. NPDC096013 TaxID=3366069 RepID=UPI00381D7EA0
MSHRMYCTDRQRGQTGSAAGRALCAADLTAGHRVGLFVLVVVVVTVGTAGGQSAAGILGVVLAAGAAAARIASWLEGQHTSVSEQGL